MLWLALVHLRVADASRLSVSPTWGVLRIQGAERSMHLERAGTTPRC